MHIQQSGKEVSLDDFAKIAKYSVCQIEYVNDIQNDENDENDENDIIITYGTGFLVKLKISMMNDTTETMYGLMTNNHVLDLKHLKNHSEFKIVFKSINTEYTVKLDKSCFLFTCELIDVTFIQFQSALIKKIQKENFLDCSMNDCKMNDSIYVVQYPKGEKLKFAHGYIKNIYGFDYLHTSSTDKGSSGSPLLNDNLKVVGIHKAKRESKKNKNENVNVATKFSIVNYAICTLYNNRYLIGMEKEKQLPKKLSEYEIEELRKHGLQETLSPQIFKIPKFKHSPELLLYRTNYAWYWMNRSKIFKKEKDLKNIDVLKKGEWSIIKSITESEDNIEYYEKLKHRQKVIINFLKLTELSFLTDYQNY